MVPILLFLKFSFFHYLVVLHLGWYLNHVYRLIYSLCNNVVPTSIMDILDEYFDRADYLIQEAEQVPLPESKRSTSSTKWKSFQKNLHKSYTKSLQDYTNDVPLRSGSDLMRDVINNYDCPRLLVNLFPVNDGYSVTLMKNDGTSAESLQMPYEECELLEYIDNEQLPPIIVDCLHKNHPEAFICGCVIAEIRDYRISIDEDSYEVHCTLLKPTQQTLNNDVNIVSDESSGSFKWGTDDKLVLESLMTLATAEPLCLDTSPTVAIIKNKIHRKKGRFNIRPMKRLIHKNGLTARRRMQMAETRPLPSALKLHTFLMERKRSKKQHTQSLSPDVKLPIGVVDVWRKEPLILTSASEIDCSKYLTALPSNSIDSTEIIEVQSILLESESGNRDVISRIAIGQRPSDMHYFGMLQSNKYFKLSKPDIQYTNQIFSLGTEHKANLYILQYHELFTEDGRRPVKVTVCHANKPPVVYHVPNQQQPWQLAQEKSLYSVGSVINIPPSKWKPMTPSTHTELKLKLQQQHNALQKQKAQQKLLQSLSNASQNPAVTTPTVNRSTTPSQAPMQNPLNIQGASGSRPRVVRTKSGTSNESTAQVQLTPQLLASGSIHQHGHLKSQTAVAKTPTQEPTRVVVAKTVSNGNNPQTVAMNSSALANAIGQIGGTVNVQVPVMTVNAQRNSVDSHERQAQTTAAVIRMPIGIAGSSNPTGQIATLNLIGGSNLLTTGTGNISIPASQLPPNFAMQLTSLANGGNQQQISLVTQSAATAQAAVQSQQISFVSQSSTNNAPFTIITNDNWQAREAGNITPQQVCYKFLLK